MRIALDAMGGDFAPGEAIKGVVAALSRSDLKILLVGEQTQLEGALSSVPDRIIKKIEIVPARETIAMDEHPGMAIRRKKDASVVVAARLVKEGKAEGFISAGNTGAAMGAALFQLGRIKGVARPAIATPFPTIQGMSLLLDAGANAEAKPGYLLQFAIMGSLYAREVLGVENPRVGLLNIGSEKEKGNELYQEAYQLLSASNLNFAGNVEGRELPFGGMDVIVCDGFVGNVVLKVVEGLAAAFMGKLRRELEGSFRTRLGGLLALPAFRRFKTHLDYREYGGAPLLGVNGISIISHGSSDARAFENAILAAAAAVKQGIVGKICGKMQDLSEG